MPQPSVVTYEQAQSIAERLLGSGPQSIESFRPPVGGDDSCSFRLVLGTEQLLLKVKKRVGSPIGVYFHRRLREAGLPVPELVAFSPTAGPGGEACALWEWVEGRPADWSAGEPCPYDEAELGELLRRIHDLRCEGPFGILGDDPGMPAISSLPDLGPQSPSWAGLFHFDSAARRCLERGYLDQREADLLSSWPERLGRELGRAECRLLHLGDIMHNGNLILEAGSGRILAILDYVESMAGDPRWELAWFDFYFGQYPFNPPSFDLARFRAAYGTMHDPDDALGGFYLATILLFEKLLFYDPASPRGRWAIRTVKNLLSVSAP